MKTAIAIWGFTLFTMGLGLLIGLTENALAGFILCVIGGAIPFSYEPIKNLFK